jgi:hypothetical protein
MNRREAIKNQGLFLFGTAISASAWSGLYLSCRPVALPDWKPSFFTVDQASLLSSITETILPKTHTPGAVETGVPQFIDKAVPALFDAETQQKIRDGLDQLDRMATTTFGKKFSICSVEERNSLLLELDRKAGTYPLSLWGITLEQSKPVGFFRDLKSLTLMAYFTSVEIGKGVLRYDPVPGDYQACIPLDGLNSWNE